MPMAQSGVPDYIKGKDGKVFAGATELDITDHESESSTDVESFGTSATNGKKATVPGNGICTGTVKGKVSAQQVVSDVLNDGDAVALKLYLTQASANNKKIYRDVSEAIITNVQYASDPSGGGSPTFSFSFTSNGNYSMKNES